MKAIISLILLVLSVFSVSAEKTPKAYAATPAERQVIMSDDAVLRQIEDIIKADLKINPNLTTTSIEIKYAVTINKSDGSVTLEAVEVRGEEVKAPDSDTPIIDVDADDDQIDEAEIIDEEDGIISDGPKSSKINLGLIIALVIIASIVLLLVANNKDKFCGLFGRGRKSYDQESYNSPNPYGQRSSETNGWSGHGSERRATIDEAEAQRKAQEREAADRAHIEAEERERHEAEERERHEAEERERYEAEERRRQAEERRHQEAANRKVLKYGQILIPGNNELYVDPDYLTDTSSNMPFCFEFNSDMSEGTYDINGEMRTLLAKDAAFLRPFTTGFASNPGANVITTVRPGKIRRKGAGWEISERLIIELR